VTLHPVAVQGLNLGPGAMPGAAQTPERRAIRRTRPRSRATARRRLDAAATVRVTDLLAGAFLGSGRLSRAARGAALTALDIFPAPRRFFARRMIYGPSALP
jgi:2-polyprenyl-6-methoxyphenol hydroxylase-like FAD-dependent oxidoreductase